MKNLPCLLLLSILFIFSCEKNQIVDPSTKLEVNHPNLQSIDASFTQSKVTFACNKVNVFSEVYTTNNFDDFDFIRDVLMDGIGFQDNCEVLYNSASQAAWEDYIDENLKVDCADPLCNTFNIWLEETQLACYDCNSFPEPSPLCEYENMILVVKMYYNNGSGEFLGRVRLESGTVVKMIDLATILGNSLSC